MMSAAGEDLASLFGDKSESRRGRLRARVDAGESRAPAAAAFGFPALRPWFSGYPTGAGVGSFLPTSCAPPPLPVWWMSPGLLAASASAHCPVSSDMGVSHMERLAPAPGVNNLMLREILATAGGRGPSASPPSMDAAAGAARRFQTGAAAAADTINGAAGGMDLQPDSSQHQQQPPSAAASPAVDHQLPSVELQSPPASPMGADKKCRLENIVSGIRPSSGSPLPVNGCKKRKLYQPVQHETRTSGGESERDEMEDAMEEEDEEESAEAMARRCQSDNMMHGQIKSVQSQLAIMQERYAQLYSNGTNNGELNREGLQQQEMDLSVRTGIRSPVATPEKPARDERPIPALHKIAEENAAGSFIDYARKVLNADHRNNKENERLRTERSGAGDFSNRLLRAAVPDVDGLADTLKSEITSSLAGLIDGIVNKWVQQRRAQAKAAETAEQAAREAYAQQILDQRRSPRAEILRRISQHNGRFPTTMASAHPFAPPESMSPFSLSTLSQMRPPGALPPLFQQAKGAGFPSTLGGNNYNSPYGLQALRDSFQHHGQQDQDDGPLSLVVTPKKKRHKVTDTRILPRGMGKLFGEDMRPQQVTSSESPSPCSYGAVPPQMLPSSLPTSVAIPNPGLHESQHFFAGYPYYKRPASPPEQRRDSDSPQTSQHPLHHHHHHAASLMHPALIAAGAGQNSPDSMGYMRDTPDRSDGNSIDGSMYETLQNGINFPGKFDTRSGLSLMSEPSTTLTPMHLRKAKLMFFWSRYPSSSILKSFFPDIHFNKNNTAQLVKWFSNFREFFYIQMEKYARQALSEGVKNPEDLTVTSDCELLRVLNLHYNRNNHSEIPPNFPFVAEAALREFLKAIQAGKDAEPSWKKAIYKVIARLDESVPEYFRSPSFLEQLE